MRYLFYTVLAFIAGLSIVTGVSALTVSPARIEITGDPGTTIHGEIEIFNEQEGVRTFFSSLENFEPSGDSGAPHFIGAKDGLATWIRTEDKIILQSGEHKKVPFSIVIPKETEPGGHFAAIFWGSQPSGANEGGEVSIGGKIGVLVLLRVAGYVPEGGGLLEFHTKENKRFFTSLPVSMVYRLNNTGGDRIVPLGDVKIKNTLRLTTEKLEANKNDGSVLPNSTRKFEVIWGDDQMDDSNKDDTGFFEMARRQWSEFHFGWYTAKLNITWGATNQTANASYNFFVIPWQLLLIILFVGFIFGFFGKVGIRKYNRYIIAQAQK
jgi:hypothetical protein